MNHRPAKIKQHIDFIDGLRGIAILGVVVSHSYYFLLSSGVGHFQFPVSATILDTGQKGVQLFFMLSAFTLFNSSYRRFKADAYPILYFYLRRFFRILPFYWIILACWLFIIRPIPGLDKISASALFYFGFIPRLGIVPGAWSLFVEETFYLLLPFVFRYITNLKKAAIFTIVLVGLSLFQPLYAYIYSSSPSLTAMSPYKNWWCFGLGIALYYLYDAPFVRKLTKTSYLPILLVLFTVFTFRLGYYFQVLSLAIMFICSFFSNNLLGRLTRVRLLRQFGIYCYSIYLIHFLIMQGAGYLKIDVLISTSLVDYPAEIKVLASFIILSSLSFLLSVVTFKYIEKPFIQLGKRAIVQIDTWLSKPITRKLIETSA